MSGKGRVLDIRKCSNCGEYIEIRHADRMDRKDVFCSKKCEGEFRKIKDSNCVCPECGVEFYLKPSRIKKSKVNYCSRNCLTKANSKNMVNENNHQYGLKGSLNPSWRSDERITNGGYKKVRSINHPLKDCDDFLLEHRLVAEQYLLNESNRIEIDGEFYLSPDFVVHHKDGNKLNNEVSNLEIMTPSDHIKFHWENKKLIGVLKLG